MPGNDGTGPGTRLTGAQLERHFARYGWTYERVAGAENIWQTGFSEDGAEFDIFIQLTDEWIIFMLYPFTLRPEGAARVRVAERLATLNYELTGAKAGLDEDGDTFLAIELPVEDFAYSHFRTALDQLAGYAHEHHMEIELLATGGA